MSAGSTMLTLSQLQAKELAGKSWNLNGSTYVFADYDRNEPGQPPWKTGTEGIAYPLLNGDGTAKAYVKFFDELKITPKRVERTRWLIDQRVDQWGGELRGAPGTWVDTKSDGAPQGIGFDFTCSLAEAVPGRTWLELKLDVVDGAARMNDDLRRRCVENLLRGLIFLERNGMVHGDLSPNNIIVNIDAQPREPTLYLIDFDAFNAAHAGELAALSTAEGGTFGTRGYCPPELERLSQGNPQRAAPFSDRYSRDMLLLELICFDSDCDFEEPPTEWKRDLLVSRLSVSPLGAKLVHLQQENIFEIAEEKRPETGDLARLAGVSTPPRVKHRRPVDHRQDGDRVLEWLGGGETWLRRVTIFLWFLCLVHVAVLGFGLTGWLIGDGAGAGAGSREAWLRFGARSLLTAGITLGSLVPLSILTFAERQERLISVLGVWLKMPAKNVNRPEFVHLAIVVGELAVILALLVASALVVVGW